MENDPEKLFFKIIADGGNEFGYDDAAAAAAIKNFDAVMLNVPQPCTAATPATVGGTTEPSQDFISSLLENTEKDDPTIQQLAEAGAEENKEEEGGSGGLHVDLGTVVSSIAKLYSIVNPSHSDLIDTHEMISASHRSAAAAAAAAATNGKTPVPSSRVDTVASQMLMEGLEKLSQDESLIKTIFDSLVATAEKNTADGTSSQQQKPPPPSSTPPPPKPMETLRIFTEITTENKTCVQRLSHGMCSPASKEFLGCVYDLVGRSRDAFVRIITLWKLFGSSIDIESLLSSDTKRLASNAVLPRSNARVANTIRNINTILDNRNSDNDNTLFTETLRYIILPVLDTFEARVEWSRAVSNSVPSQARRIFDKCRSGASSTGFVKIDSATRDMVFDDIRNLDRKQNTEISNIFNSFMSIADGTGSPSAILVFADSPMARVAKTVQLSDPLTVLRYLFQILDESDISIQRLCTTLHSSGGDNIFWKLLYDMICKTYAILKLIILTWKVVGSLMNLDFFLSSGTDGNNITLSADDPRVTNSIKDIRAGTVLTDSASLVQFTQRLIVPVLYAISDRV